MQRCCIWRATGDELQLVAAPGKRDQRPVQVILEHALVSPQSPAAPGTHWDTDKFMHGVLQGENRTPFVHAVEAKCQVLLQSPAWHQAICQGHPDKAWQMLRRIVVDVARPLFQQAPTCVKQAARPTDTSFALQRQHDCKFHFQNLPRARRFWSHGGGPDYVPLQALSDLLHR